MGSDPRDAHRGGSDALMAGLTVASPQAGPLLRVSPAPAPRSGAQILVDALKVQGVDLAFGVPGESYLAVLDALYDAPQIDVVTCRLAAHHFYDVPAFCREVARVLKPGGRAVVQDTITPEEDLVRDFINDVEARRDPSHVDDYKASTWRRLLEDAGLVTTSGWQSLTEMGPELVTLV